jgi:hypothetical protein
MRNEKTELKFIIARKEHHVKSQYSIRQEMHGLFLVDYPASRSLLKKKASEIRA